MSDVSPDMKTATAFGPPWQEVAHSSVYRMGLKRIIDVILCLLVLPVVSPLILLLYLLSRLDGGPGFFGHMRSGRNGRRFCCWKIRTMVPNAEGKLTTMLCQNQALRREWDSSQKLKCDPRVTQLGGVLRKTGFDELPQIWNVLRGDMSFVGPRPVTQDELARYGKDRSCYSSIRPGVTGLWQVSGRNDISYQNRIDLDRTYVQTLSFKLDCLILLKTVWVVLKRTGY